MIIIIIASKGGRQNVNETFRDEMEDPGKGGGTNYIAKDGWVVSLLFVKVTYCYSIVFWQVEREQDTHRHPSPN